jgi:hypothetical protein
MESKSVSSSGREPFKRRGAAQNFAVGVRVSKRHEPKCGEPHQRVLDRYVSQPN